MPSPRVFISSTYVNLADVRSVVEAYFKELLYETAVVKHCLSSLEQPKPGPWSLPGLREKSPPKLT